LDLLTYVDVVGEGLVVEMGESGVDGAARREVEASRQIDVALLPEGLKGISVPRAGCDYVDTGDAHAGEVQLLDCIRREPLLVFLRNTLGS